MMTWDFLSIERWQFLTAIVAYIFGGIVVIRRRMASPGAEFGVRTESGCILIVVAAVLSIGMLIYIGVAYGLLAALATAGIGLPVAFVLNVLKGLLYPFLE